MRMIPFLIVLLLAACSGGKEGSGNRNPLFKRLTTSETGIDFRNTLTFKEDFDVFRYRNYYNGAGVGIGDINNDNLPDLYLTSNMGENKLYLNKRKFSFQKTSLQRPAWREQKCGLLV